MTSSPPARPPRLAEWLVSLFASPREVDAILGDLAEEFDERAARDGATLARRTYWRHARQTMRDLALSPMRLRAEISGPTARGVLLTAALGIAGLLVTLPIGAAARAWARAIVTRVPVYTYIPASVFWRGVDVFGLLVGGIVVALVARAAGIRPMSAAFAMVAALAVLFAVDLPIMMWLYGPRLTLPHVTLVSFILRWARGVVMFGSVLTIGAAIGRLVPFGVDAPRRPRLS